MKVLFISRSTLYNDRGGDTIQIENTAHFLRNMGLDVTIRLADEKIDYEVFDLIHFFNLIRPADILPHLTKSDKPFVVSTIFVDYSEYEQKVRGGVMGYIARNISLDNIEYLKAIARFIINGQKIKSLKYLISGHRKSIKFIIQNAAILLPNSRSEYERISIHYKIEQKFKVIPNAINPALFKIPAGTGARDLNQIICVGRIEGRKNQLNLIKALNNTAYKLIIIGSPSANQQKYYELCLSEAQSNITFVSVLPQDKLIEYYQTAHVHVLPSWFETTGLSSLEAAVMGCKVVITAKGDTTEYFENYAYYCDPSSPASILKAIEEAMRAPFRDDFQNKILDCYTWKKAAEKTLEAYLEIKGDSNNENRNYRY